MSTKRALGDTEKTVLVGALVLGFWLGIDAITKRAEKRDIEANGQAPVPKAGPSRRMRIARIRRRRREAA